MKKIFLLMLVVTIGSSLMAQDTSKRVPRTHTFDTLPHGQDSATYKKWKNDKMQKDKRKNKRPDSTGKIIDTLKL
jgi:hypothetical protein